MSAASSFGVLWGIIFFKFTLFCVRLIMSIFIGFIAFSSKLSSPKSTEINKAAQNSFFIFHPFFVEILEFLYKILKQIFK